MLRPELIFLNLFLNLMAGPQVIQVLPPPQTRVVELRLDGEGVAERCDAPWRFSVDLGPGVLPHRLTAVAMDGEGTQLAESSQLINLGIKSADCRFLPEKSGTMLSLACKSTMNRRIIRTEVLMDGRSVNCTPDASFLLPQDRGIHIVSATVHFDGGEVARAETIVSGENGANIVSALTGLSMRLDASSTELPVDRIRASLRKTGTPLRVRAVEHGEPLVVAVVSREARKRLAMQQVMENATENAIDRARARWWRNRWEAMSVRAEELESGIRRSGRVEPILRQVDPIVDPDSGKGLLPSLFPMTDPIPLSLESLRLLAVAPWKQDRKDIQRISDALVVAGALATAEKSPRTVLLIVDRHDQDESLQKPDQAVTYLDALGVPLVIWTTGGKKGVESPWGSARKVVLGRETTTDAAEDLNRFLNQWRIVWVEGAWLPGEVEIGTAPPSLQESPDAGEVQRPGASEPKPAPN